VRRWRRVCWRRVRMHDVQTVEEDIFWCCWWCWYNVVEEDGDRLPSPSKFPLVMGKFNRKREWMISPSQICVRPSQICL
jgi:hypothetical protein